MKSESVLWTLAIVAVVLLVAFWKHKVCIDPDGTSHGPYPWVLPCSSNQQSVTA